MRNRWHSEHPIYRGQKPTVVHQTLAEAFAEADRLSQLHPRGHFAVFECIGFVKGKRPKTKNPEVELGALAGT